MKKIYCCLFLLMSFVGLSQNQISFGNNPIPKSKFQYGLQNISFNPLSINFSYANKKEFASGNVLSIYNPMTQMNDNFVRVNDLYYQSNVKSFPYYGWDGSKIDSLNPYGSSDLGSSVLCGLVNLLINPKSGF